MTKYEKTLAIALETLGCCVVAAGIAVEVATGAGVGHVVITSGCLVAFVGGVLYTKVFVKTKP